MTRYSKPTTMLDQNRMPFQKPLPKLKTQTLYGIKIKTKRSKIPKKKPCFRLRRMAYQKSLQKNTGSPLTMLRRMYVVPVFTSPKVRKVRAPKPINKYASGVYALEVAISPSTPFRARRGAEYPSMPSNPSKTPKA